MPITAEAPPQPLPEPVAVSLSVESAEVAEGTRMGMVGLHYLRPLSPKTYGGISVFGATHGDRGGFFGWGVSGGWRESFGRWHAQAGLFVGGGGGSPGWVGGGFMLRPHAELGYDFGGTRLGLGVAQLRFPSAGLRSTHPYAALSWDSAAVFGPAGTRGPVNGSDWSAQAMPREIAGTAGSYRMRKGSVRRDGTGSGPAMQHGGLSLRRTLPGSFAGGQPYWVLSAAGSITGAYAGYAELLGGLGAQWALPVGLPLALRAQAELGAGGAGASADTGGGTLRKASAGLSWQGAGWSLSGLVGRVDSRGPFAANEARLELAVSGWDVVPGDRRGGGAAPAALQWAPWSLSAAYLRYPRMLRDDGQRLPLGMVSLKAEREITPQWRLLGQADIAASGNAGGYAAGHLGLGWLSEPLGATPWQWGLEGSLGAAGGGAVSVGRGLFAQGQLQARYTLARDWALRADLGWFRSVRGPLSSPLLGLELVYSFSRVEGR